jgi:hypothetical protein
VSTALINFPVAFFSKQRNSKQMDALDTLLDTLCFCVWCACKRLGAHLCVARAYHLPGVDPPHNNYFSRGGGGGCCGGGIGSSLSRPHALVLNGDSMCGWQGHRVGVRSPTRGRLYAIVRHRTPLTYPLVYKSQRRLLMKVRKRLVCTPLYAILFFISFYLFYFFKKIKSKVKKLKRRTY